jgi:transposase, IS5 family
LYEIESVRRFAGLKLSGPIPDETTILKFRHMCSGQPKQDTFI